MQYMLNILTIALAMATCVYLSRRNRDKRHFPNTKHEFAACLTSTSGFLSNVISSATKVFFTKEVNWIQSLNKRNYNDSILMNNLK